jgi:hypothetical protein
MHQVRGAVVLRERGAREERGGGWLPERVAMLAAPCASICGWSPAGPLPAARHLTAAAATCDTRGFPLAPQRRAAGCSGAARRAPRCLTWRPG